jgi:hypothetical protein
MPYVLSERNAFSTSAPNNPSPKVSRSKEEKKSGSSGLLSGLLLGGFILGGSALAYNYGYFDSFLKDAKAPTYATIDKNTQNVSAETPVPLESVEIKDEKPAQLESVTTEAEQTAPPESAEPDTIKVESELHPIAPSDESINTKENVPVGIMQDEPVVSDVKSMEPESVTQDTELKDPEELANKNTADEGGSVKKEQVADDLATISRKVEEAGPLDDVPPKDITTETQKVSIYFVRSFKNNPLTYNLKYIRLFYL